MQFDVKSIFPYKEIRNAQSEALDFALDAFINQGKKFVIIEAGTGVGKSAVGVTLSRYMDTQPTHTPAGEEEGHSCTQNTTRWQTRNTGGSRQSATGNEEEGRTSK